jgi:uncharacterized protein YbjT (DUF2867 family)
MTKILLFGATGMIGQATLLECLDDPEVEQVRAVVRRPTGRTHEKLDEVVVDDFSDLAHIEDRLSGYDGCLFCLGVSAAGLTEDAYRKITYDYTLAAARSLAKTSPNIVFCYVSGAGTDSTEKGFQMWARVKGKTENDLLALLERAVMFRPGFIQPVRGVVSSTGWYRRLYSVVGVLYPAISAVFPRSVMTSATLGKALIAAVKRGAPKRVLEASDIIALAG